jgi:hypothetical protein
MYKLAEGVEYSTPQGSEADFADFRSAGFTCGLGQYRLPKVVANLPVT